MLTHKQRDMLVLIQDRTKEDGVPPSYEEMAKSLGLSSKSGVHRLIKALEERGYIRRLPHRARAIEVLALPADLEEVATKPAINQRFAQIDSHQDSLRRIANPLANSGRGNTEIPFMGRIAAGTPIEAIRHEGQSVSVPPGMLGRGTCYALEIHGDSMVEEGIFDGDQVVIEETSVANNGEIVVALVDESEATLKRFRRLEGMIALEPANRHYEIQYLRPEQVRVQGRLIGLLRRY